MLTRRRFLYGAVGVGALAAMSSGASIVAKQMQRNPDDDITVLDVPDEAVLASDSDEFAASFVQAEEPQELINLTGAFELPYGTLVWASDDRVAACLLPTDKGKPLTNVALLSLDTGIYTTVLEHAVGIDEGFEIYDVRATSSGLLWTESDILDGIWRVYSASSDGIGIGAPALLEEGRTVDWDTPTIAAVGNRAFWQMLPKKTGSQATEPSVLKRATMGAANAETMWTSHGRMATAPYSLEKAVVITPRTDTSSIHYQLTCIDAETGETLDSMCLPASMKPLEAGYGTTGFMFSFDAGYQYGGGIAKLGTYAPASAVPDGNYSDAPWFRYSRNPSAAPAWCGPYLMVKSNTSVVGIDFDAKRYFALDVQSGSDKYGDYLASTGVRSTAVTFSNIDDKPLGGEPKKYCLVRVWSAAR